MLQVDSVNKMEDSQEPLEDEDEIIKYGELTIDRSSYKVILKKNEISLPRKEFELLFLLASKPGKVFKREFILESIWGKDVIVGDRTIDVHIRKLREKIGDSFFKTIKGVGCYPRFWWGYNVVKFIINNVLK